MFKSASLNPVALGSGIQVLIRVRFSLKLAEPIYDGLRRRLDEKDVIAKLVRDAEDPRRKVHPLFELCPKPVLVPLFKLVRMEWEQNVRDDAFRSDAQDARAAFSLRKEAEDRFRDVVYGLMGLACDQDVVRQSVREGVVGQSANEGGLPCTRRALQHTERTDLQDSFEGLRLERVEAIPIDRREVDLMLDEVRNFEIAVENVK
jgi:hypothetical protein